MTKSDIAELVAYVEDLKRGFECTLQGERSLFQGCASRDAEEKHQLRKDIQRANQENLRLLEEKDHWRSRALIAEDKLKGTGGPSTVDEPTITIDELYATPKPPQNYVRFTNSGDGPEKSTVDSSRHNDIRVRTPQWVKDKLAQEPQPLRLLVEVVQKKDEIHGCRYWQGHGAHFQFVRDSDERAFSIQELPPMPTLTELWEIFLTTDWMCGRRPGNLIPVLKACGLEVE